MIKIKNIVENKNFRSQIKDSELIGLMESIKEVGLLQPIGVRELPSKGKKKVYEILYGNRRLNAFKKLGYSEIPAIVRIDTDELEELTVNLVENIQRSQIPLYDLSVALETLKTKFHMSPQEIAVRLSMPAQRVQGIINMRRITGFKTMAKYIATGDDRMASKKGKIPLKTATLIFTALRNNKDQEELIKKVKEDNIDFDKVKNITQLCQKGFPLDKALATNEKSKSVRISFLIEDSTTKKVKNLEQEYGNLQEYFRLLIKKHSEIPVILTTNKKRKK